MSARYRVVVALAVTSFVGVSAPSVSVAATSVTLEARGLASVPQGMPMLFRAILNNPDGAAGTMDVGFQLVHSGAEPLTFEEWTGTLQPGETRVVEGSVTPSQWFTETGPYEILAGGARLAFEVTSPHVAVPIFQDVTAEVGLTTHHLATILCDNYAAGAAWGDVEGDGDLDLYLPHQEGPAQLFVNQTGTFVERAAAAGVDNGGRIGMGAVFVDYDNDGDQDLYAVNDGPNRLYRNDGNGAFTDVAAAAGVADAGPGSSAAWGDYDDDGLLDLYVVNYGRCEESEAVYADLLYHNQGDGTFTDTSALLPQTGTTQGLGFQAAWFDYDSDGDLDLYLANDHVRDFDQPNILWRNDGPDVLGWTFTNVSEESGAGIGINSMGVGISDYDRDGDLDLAISNMMDNALLRNEGNGTFTDQAAFARVNRPMQRAGQMSVTWGLSFADLNNDTWEDLYVGAGSMGMHLEPHDQPNEVFVNGGDGRFLDLSAPSGAADPDITRGVALADYDRDGRMDVYVVNQSESPRLYRNVTPEGGHWLEVDTVGVASNRDGCGARLVAQLGPNERMVREVSCGSTGLGTGSDSTVHFGLGNSSRVSVLTVVWPSGTCQTLRNVGVDRLLRLTEAASGSGTSRNCIPSVTVTSPNGGEYWNGTKSITWTASDGDADLLSYTAQWTTDGITYTNICTTGLLTCSWNTASVADGVAYKIRVLAADAHDVGNDSSNANFTVDNTLPSLTHSLSGTLGGGGWYRSSVTVTLACTDATAGVNSIRYAVNGGASTPYSSPFTISAQGIKTFTATCDDRATNVANIGPITVKIDTVAPTITHSEAGTAGGGGWYRSPVTVTLTCTDASSDVASHSYVLDGGPSTPYGAPFSITGDGTHSFNGTCNDVAGNSSSTGAQTVRIDTVAPSITHSESGTAGGGGWWHSSVTVTLTCSDAMSGVGGTTYTVDGGAPVTYSEPFSITTNGNHSVNATCSDVAGNSDSTGSYAINIDAVAPTLSYSLGGTLGSGGWYRSNVAVTLTCTDPASDVGSRTYVLDGGPSTPYGAPFTITGNGTHSFTGACNDVAGNSSSTGAQTVRIDTVIPSLTHSLSGTLGGGGWYRSSVTVTLTCADATSGVDVTTYTVDGGAPQTYTGPFSITTDGNHPVVANCSDVAGNASATDTFPVKIDRTAPTVVLSAPRIAIASYNVNWTAWDPLSGLTGSIQIQEQATILGSGFGTVCTTAVSGAIQSGSCPRAPLVPNIYCYRAIVSDVAGNTTTTGGSDCSIYV